METKCAVFGCKNTSQLCPTLFFFEFPINPSMFKRWINACGNEDLNPKLRSNYSVCSIHFQEKDFEYNSTLTGGNKIEILNCNAVPSQFLFNGVSNFQEAFDDEFTVEVENTNSEYLTSKNDFLNAILKNDINDSMSGSDIQDVESENEIDDSVGLSEHNLDNLILDNNVKDSMLENNRPIQDTMSDRVTISVNNIENSTSEKDLDDAMSENDLHNSMLEKHNAVLENNIGDSLFENNTDMFGIQDVRTELMGNENIDIKVENDDHQMQLTTLNPGMLCEVQMDTDSNATEEVKIDIDIHTNVESTTDIEFLNCGADKDDEPEKKTDCDESNIDPLSIEAPANSENPQNHESENLQNNSLIKPNKTYIQLIGEAILSTPNCEMRYNDIQEFISNHYEYYRKNILKSWKGCIRHNLTLSRYFQKMERNPNDLIRKGKRWTITPRLRQEFLRAVYTKDCSRYISPKRQKDTGVDEKKILPSSINLGPKKIYLPKTNVNSLMIMSPNPLTGNSERVAFIPLPYGPLTYEQSQLPVVTESGNILKNAETIHVDPYKNIKLVYETLPVPTSEVTSSYTDNNNPPKTHFLDNPTEKQIPTTSADMANTSCIICKENISNTDNVVTVRKKGRNTLLMVSSMRDDGLQEELKLASPLRLHSHCRKKYANMTISQLSDVPIIKQLEFLNSYESNNVEAPLTCPLCEYRTPVRRKMQLHLKIHTDKNQRDHKCDQCELEYISETTLKRHKRDKHPPHLDKQVIRKRFHNGFPAPKNTKVSSNKAPCRDKTITDDKKFKCYICKYKTNVYKQLFNHLAHHGSGSY